VVAIFPYVPGKAQTLSDWKTHRASVAIFKMIGLQSMNLRLTFAFCNMYFHRKMQVLVGTMRCASG